MAGDKFGRNYFLTILPNEGFAVTNGQGVILSQSSVSGIPVTIAPPFTIEFDITRTNQGTSPNSAMIRIINLSKINRDLIQFNVFQQQIFHQIELLAGYGHGLTTIIKGNIREAYSVREGDNFITTIHCFDGGWAYTNSYVSLPVPAGVPNQAVVQTLQNMLMPTVSPSTVNSTIAGTSLRGRSYSGFTATLLCNLTGGQFFIDNSVSYILGNSDCILGDLTVIDDAVGILSTPLFENGYLIVELLFEPRIRIAQQLTLKSKLAPQYNGVYKVSSVHHRGMISDAVCGDCITSVTLYNGGDGPPKVLV